MPRTLTLSYPYPHSVRGDDGIPLSPTSSASSFDEEDVNIRMAPNWCAYRHLLERRGVRLDTCRDVKQWYQDYWERQLSQGYHVTKDLPGYARACSIPDENELCKDAGLVRIFFISSRGEFSLLRHSQITYSAARTARRDRRL